MIAITYILSSARRQVSCMLTGLCLCLAGCAAPTEYSSLIVVENVNVIDAAAGLRPDMTVAISGTKIIDVLSGDKARFSYRNYGPVTYIDGTGHYLLPGLWDAHVHLTYQSGLGYKTFFPLAIAHGVTSLRDTGGQLVALATAREVSVTDAEAPDLYIAGPLIDGPKRIYDGSSVLLPDISVGARSPEDAEQIVDELAVAGVDFIKAYELLDGATLKSLIDRASFHGLKVAAHPPLGMTADEVVALGAQDFQHFRNLEFQCSGDSDALLKARRSALRGRRDLTSAELRDQIRSTQRPLALGSLNADACGEFVKKLAKLTVFQTPTMSILTLSTRRPFLDADWQETFRYLPEPVERGWRGAIAAVADRPAAPQEDHDFLSWVSDLLAMLTQANVPLMAGTDAPIGFQTPGQSLHEELELFVEYGLTPLEAIEAATLTPARFFGIEGTQGLIAPGMKADLVLLRENPLDDIRNIGSIETVVKNGHVLDRERLDQILENLAAR
jgi:hypothetical protein